MELEMPLEMRGILVGLIRSGFGAGYGGDLGI